MVKTLTLKVDFFCLNSKDEIENHKPYECVSLCICILLGAEFIFFGIFQLRIAVFYS